MDDKTLVTEEVVNEAVTSEAAPAQAEVDTTKKIGKLKKFTWGKFAIYFVLICWALTTIFPFVWVINNSVKDKQYVLPFETSFLPAGSSKLSDPDVMYRYNASEGGFTLANYKKAFTGTINVGTAYLISILISGSVTIFVVLLSGFAGFGMTRYNFKGRWIFHSLITASMMFPAFSTVIPVLTMMTNFNLIDNPVGVILPQIAGNLSFAILILVGYIRGLPIDLEEAAFMEGCNVYQIFFKVIMPISRPSFATVAIFTFLWSYNDLFMQKIIIRSRPKFPICCILDFISSQWGGTDYGLMAAAVTIVVLPVLIIYIFLQKNIIKGLTAGAVKG